MIARFLFFLLCALSIFALLRGLRRKDGLFQFPVMFSAAFAFSIIPQLVNHVFYPGRLPTRVYDDHGVEYGILMCILCLVIGNAGYRTRPKNSPPVWAQLIPTVTTPKRLFWAGAFLCVVGLLGTWRLDALAGGFLARFTQGGHYALAWSGSSVVWSYVGKCLWLGLVLCLNSTMRSGSLFRWAFTLSTMVYPVMSIVFLGRRSPTLTLTVVWGLSLFFQKRWVPPRWVALAAMSAAGALVILMPYYRGEANRTGDVGGAIRQVDVGAGLDAYMRGEKGEGMDNLIVGIPARMSHPSFNLGLGFWDGAIDYLVPAQFVGREVKDGLMVNLATPDSILFPAYCDAPREFDAFMTGPYSVYIEFWFLGCLLFLPVARFYQRLWYLAYDRGVLGAQVIYIAIVMVIPQAVVNSLTDAFPQFLLAVGVLLPALWSVGRRSPVWGGPGQLVKLCNVRLVESGGARVMVSGRLGSCLASRARLEPPTL